MSNTHSMSLEPQPQAEYNQMDELPQGKFGLMPVMSGEMFNKQVQYGIIVEMWSKTKFGRVKREFHKAFTEAERKKIGSYHGRFYRWMMVEGTPARVSMRLSTLNLLQRAVHFFSTV